MPGSVVRQPRLPWAVLVAAARRPAGRGLCRRAGGSGDPAAAGQPDAGRAPTFRPALQALDDAHPEWTVAARGGAAGGGGREGDHAARRRRPARRAAPAGLNVQQWIRRDAFVDLDDRDRRGQASTWPTSTRVRSTSSASTTSLWGIPDTATPEVVYYNTRPSPTPASPPPTTRGPTTTCATPPSR